MARRMIHVGGPGTSNPDTLMLSYQRVETPFRPRDADALAALA